LSPLVVSSPSRDIWKDLERFRVVLEAKQRHGKQDVFTVFRFSQDTGDKMIAGRVNAKMAATAETFRRLGEVRAC
jgi:hypothetical protein